MFDAKIEIAIKIQLIAQPYLYHIYTHRDCAGADTPHQVTLLSK